MGEAAAESVPERIEIRRSVGAGVEQDRVVVLMPTGLSDEQEQEHVHTLLARLRRHRQRTRLEEDDFTGQAARLSRAHLQGQAHPVSVRWVTTRAAAEAPARSPRARSASPARWQGCPGGWSTPCWCTSSPTCSCPTTAPSSPPGSSATRGMPRRRPCWPVSQPQSQSQSQPPG